MRIHKLTDLPPELQEAVREAAAAGDVVSNLRCPACDGGRSSENSLSVIPDAAGLMGLKCWRAGCGYHAKVPLGDDVEIKAPRFQPRAFRQDTVPVNPEKHPFLCHYVIGEQSSRWFQKVVDAPHVYMPVHSPSGKVRGGVLRKFGIFEGPKAITYKTTDQPWLAWYRNTGADRLVIVEDQLSAIRCWQLGYDAVALLGTNLNHAKWEEIKDVAGWDRTPVLALDNDAFQLALKYAQKFGRMTVVLLERDLKDCNDGEIIERIEG